jgi:microcystin degradation protein MlrC
VRHGGVRHGHRRGARAGRGAALRQAIADAEGDFHLELLTPDEGVRRAMQRGTPGAPVVLADTQDNPGAGGNGDTTGLLASLVAHDAPGSVLGLLIDPASAKQAHEVGERRTSRFRLGEISGLPGHVPFDDEFIVERVADGRFTCTGPMFQGFRMDLGPMALLRRGNVRVVLASVKCQAADQAMFRHVGIEPRTERVLALKSSVHFRADFQPIAREVLVVAARTGEGRPDDVHVEAAATRPAPQAARPRVRAARRVIR